MNSLSLGFLYICGLSWLLCEVCVSASSGNSLPLVLFMIGFVVMFAILGCIRLSNDFVELAGPVFTLLIGLGIVIYGLGAINASAVGAVLRLLGGGILVAFGVVGLLEKKKADGSSAH